MTETCALHGWNQSQTWQEVWTLLLKEEEEETVYKLPTFILLSLLMLVGLPGNVLVLLVYGFRFPASTTRNFIMAMAVFDLINCLLGLPFEMVDLRYDMELDIAVACKIIRFFISLSTCGSVTVLLAVSVDRFRRICQPFQKQMTVRQSKIVIGAMTFVSVGFAGPALILYGRHTEIRYGIELHDCSIDDVYKSGRFAAIYQYVLGITWTASIGVLITMYSFVIYKIHLQKKRRNKLSNQSHDSTAVLVTQRVHTNDDSSPKYNGVTRSSNEHSSFTTGAHITATLAENRTSSGAGDDDAAKSKGNRFVNRLFSRDVNPILEDDEDDETDLRLYDSGDEDMPDAGCEFSARLIRYKKTSLNNYLAGSRDTQLTNRSDSLAQTDAAESSRGCPAQDAAESSRGCPAQDAAESSRGCPAQDAAESSRGCPAQDAAESSRGCPAQDAAESSRGCPTQEAAESSRGCPTQEAAMHRTRKYGYSFGWYRPWESDTLIPSVGMISSAGDRGWISHSDQTLAPSRVRSHGYRCHIGRSSSLCSLKCVLNQQRSAHANKTSSCYGNEQCPNLKHANNGKTRRLELNADRDTSQQASPDTSLLDTHSKILAPDWGLEHVTHPVGHAHQLNICESEGPCSQSGSHFATDPVLRYKHRLADTVPTLMKKQKKKSLAREIKTSRVTIMMLMVTLGFVLSFLPHLFIQIYKRIAPSTVAGLLCSSRVYFVLLHLLIRTFFINNAINPIIYSFYNKTFRDRCLRLLRAPKSLLQSSEHHIALSFSQDNDTS